MSTVADLVVASATVKGGKLFVRDRRDFDRQVAQFKDGLELELTLQRKRATRSLQANHFYWGVVIHEFHKHCKKKDLGYTENDLHEVCKAKFLPKQLVICDGNGEVVADYVMGGSTRGLNVNEFYDYVEQVRQWLAELGIPTDDPDPEWRA